MRSLLKPELTLSPWQQTHSQKWRGGGQWGMDGMHRRFLSKILSRRDAEGAWGCVRQLGSAITLILVLHSSSFPLYHQPHMPVWYTWVWEDAKAWQAMLVLQPSTPASCSLPNPLAAGSWAEWLSPFRPQAHILFPWKKESLLFHSLSQSLFLNPPFLSPSTPSLALSFSFPFPLSFWLDFVLILQR